jgi:hypothetical protein
LGREYLLAGHLIDRAGMPHVLAGHGLEAMRDVAIEEWMGASPVYTRRTQRALGFAGDDVATIFKGMQLDIGAPHQFMDFRYRVQDPSHGEFWLASCGALMDVEPMGEDYVVAMCHHIEDPTFDATAAATNPRARMRPLHRPPRQPADRHPHCHWVVEIDPSADPVPEPEAARRVSQSLAAASAIRPDAGRGADDADPGGRQDDGRGDYGGDFDPDFSLDDLSRPALEVVVQEVCLQGHLLAHSFMLAVEDRFGAAEAERIAAKQLVGIAGLTARRLATALQLGGGIEAIGHVLLLHPLFQPRAYVDAVVESEGQRMLVSIGECDALSERGGWSWPALLAAGHVEALDALVRCVDARARCQAVAPPSGRHAAWEVDVDVGAPAAPEPREVTLARFSTGADFVFSEV